MRGISGAPQNGKVRFYKDAAADLQSAFADIEKRQLLSRIKSWDGSYVPRTIRGASRPSNHAWGIAFDIDVEFNPTGQKPLEAGQEGSVVELVPIFAAYHFEWGGDYPRPEADHFQWIPLTKRK